MSPNAMDRWSALELSEALRQGKVSAMEIADVSIVRHQATGDRLGAYVAYDPEGARAQAGAADDLLKLGRDLGPLMGLPISVKDLFGVPGFATYAGTPRRLPPAWERPGPIVQACLRSMAVLVGKTHMVELAFGGIGANAHWGTPRNPWDTEVHRVPGGSSAGAAVSLVERSAVIALGTDTAGSIRVPAAWTGCVGFKTTAGRWSTDGIVPLSPTLDSAGILTRSVADARWATRGIDPGWEPSAGSARSIAGLVFGVPKEVFYDDLDPGVGESVERALRELEAAGARVIPVAFPEALDAQTLFARGSVTAVELWSFLKRDLPDWIETLEPRVKQRLEAASELPAVEYLDRCSELRRLRVAARERMDALGIHVLASPTVASTPPPVDAVGELEAYVKANLRALRNTSIGNGLGMCAEPLPAGLDAASMPVGLQMAARPHDDLKLLGWAASAERVIGTPLERLGSPPGS